MCECEEEPGKPSRATPPAGTMSNIHTGLRPPVIVVVILPPLLPCNARHPSLLAGVVYRRVSLSLGLVYITEILTV